MQISWGKDISNSFLIYVGADISPSSMPSGPMLDRGPVGIWNSAYKVRSSEPISGWNVMVHLSSITSRGTTYWFLYVCFSVSRIFRLRMRNFPERKFRSKKEKMRQRELKETTSSILGSTCLLTRPSTFRLCQWFQVFLTLMSLHKDKNAVANNDKLFSLLLETYFPLINLVYWERTHEFAHALIGRPFVFIHE